MKTYKTLIMLCLIAVGALILSQCKKDTETVTNTVHDTTTVHDTVTHTIHDTLTVNDTVYIQIHDTTLGKTLSGYASYPNYTGGQVAAKGGVVYLYLGTSKSGPIGASAIIDASGNYTLPFLIPGNYFIWALYNTTNTNAGRDINGINFQTDPGYTITMGSSNVIQNLALVSYTTPGALKIAIDTINANQTFRKVAFEAHSKLNFSFQDKALNTTVAGGFNTFTMEKFAFDEANPNNIVIQGYTLLSGVNTFEPARDAVGMSGSGTNNLPNFQATGCTHLTLHNYVDSALFYANALDTCIMLPETDTVRFVASSVKKYGDGYLATGTLTGFFMHPVAGPMAGITDGNYQYKSDSAGFAAVAGHAYNGPMSDGVTSKTVYLYFNFDKQKINTTTSFNWWFIFEGEFTFNPVNDFYIATSHIGTGDCKIACHVQMQGTTGKEY
jgi:hypothetical protein